MNSFYIWLEEIERESPAMKAAANLIAKTTWPSSLHQLRRDRLQSSPYFAGDKNDAAADAADDAENLAKQRQLYRTEKPQPPQPLTHPGMIDGDQWSKERAWPPPDTDVDKISTPTGSRSTPFTRPFNSKLKGDEITPEIVEKIKKLVATGHTNPSGIALKLSDPAEGDHKLNYKDVAAIIASIK